MRGLSAAFAEAEDLNHTGAHKINNVIGQALIAKRLGKRRIIAEMGCWTALVATATACSPDLDGIVYMGVEDMRRQKPNVYMRLMGCDVRGVESGTKTLKDAVA